MLSTAPIRAYIPATDVARARKLYEEKIGMRPKEEYAGGVIYECGGAEVFLYGTKNAGRPRRVRPTGRLKTWRPRSPSSNGGA